VTLPRAQIRTLLLLACAAVAAHAQTPAPTVPLVKKPRPARPQSPYNPNVILLDPAHGGADSGAKLSDDALEKDATVAFAARLKTVLAARGFTVLITHESASDAPTSDQRAEIANRSRAVACLLLHASNGGHGVHLFTSSLASTTPADASPDDIRSVLPWGTAQSAILPQSTRLAGELSDAVHAIRVPLVLGQSSVQPIDSFGCPAVAVELSPLAPADEGDDPTLASDPAYQQRIAEAIAAALDSWRGHVVAEINGANTAAPPAPATPAPKPTPKPAPKSKPKSIPEETPDIISAPEPKKPAPIVRRPPETPPPGGQPQ
jgi:N-acetylmuramoyl-L-alanine amidase